MLGETIGSRCQAHQVGGRRPSVWDIACRPRRRSHRGPWASEHRSSARRLWPDRQRHYPSLWRHRRGQVTGASRPNLATRSRLGRPPAWPARSPTRSPSDIPPVAPTSRPSSPAAPGRGRTPARGDRRSSAARAGPWSSPRPTGRRTRRRPSRGAPAPSSRPSSWCGTGRPPAARRPGHPPVRRTCRRTVAALRRRPRRSRARPARSIGGAWSPSRRPRRPRKSAGTPPGR